MGQMYSQSDYESNRLTGSSGYLIFFLPFLLCKDSKYGKYCANQGLIGLLAILLVMVCGWILGLIVGWIPVIGTIVSAVVRIARILIAIIMLYHFYLAAFKGSAKPLPYIGMLELIK